MTILGDAAKQLDLAHVRVVDAAHVLAGPYAATLLADLGCEVIKVEQPQGGDPSRRSLGTIEEWGESLAFAAVNRNKRSITIDLKHPDGVSVFHRLIGTADVMIESYKVGTAERLGVGWDTLKQVNPALIYAGISGHGRTGPAASKGGYDIIAQGLAGVMSVTGYPGGPPAKAGVPIADLGAGIYCVVGILAALLMREGDGLGRRVDTSLFEAALSYGVWESSEYWRSGDSPTPLGSAHRMSAPYQAVATTDGYVTLGVNNDRQWAELARGLEHPEWTQDPRFATNAQRVKNRDELIEAIEAKTREMASADLVDLLDAHKIPAGRVMTYAEALADPQTIARNMVVEAEHPVAGPIKMLGCPVKIDSLDEAVVRRPPPTLGQHTDEVLHELGYSEAEIASLRDEGAT